MKAEIQKRIAQIQKDQSPTGYRKTEVGIIPCSWQIMHFGDIGCGFEYGMNAPAVEYDGEHKYIRITDIDEETHKYIDQNPVSPGIVANDDYLVKEHDILFARTGASVGKAYLYDRQDGELYFAGFLIRMHITAAADSRFVFYQTQTVRYSNWVRVISVRSGQPGINAQEYSLFRSAYPPMEEQKKIVKILNLQDRCIELKRKLIEEKLRQKRHLLQQLLTGKIRLPHFTDKWKREPLGAYLTEEKEIARPDIQCRITVKLNLNGVERRVLSATEKKDATVQYLRRAGQFIYGKQNLFKGALGIVPNDLDGFQSSSDIPSFTVSHGLLVQWVFYWFSRESYYKNLEKLASGTGSKRIPTETFLALNILVPPIEEQRTIVECLSLVDKELELLRLEIEQEKQKKKALMQLLLTGIVRVKE